MADLKWRRKSKDGDLQQELKRRALLDKAAHLFTTKGYSSTSLDDLAAALKLTKPALYYYSKNKEDILDQCLGISMEILQSLVRDAMLSSELGLEQLQILFKDYAKFAVGDYGYGLVTEGLKHLKGQRRKKMLDRLRNVQDLVEEVVVLGVQDGTISPLHSKRITHVLFSAYNQMISWYDPSGELSPEQLSEQILDVIVQGLQPRN